MKLIKPTAELKESFVDFIADWRSTGEKIVPYSVSQEPSEFELALQTWCDQADESKVPEGLVPASTYFLVDNNSYIYGAINIRHALNDNLKRVGGHIGYGIRPSERKKGYATLQLQLALKEAKKLGIDRAMITCDSDNIGSARTIEKCGGEFDSLYIDENGAAYKRYWVEV